MRNHLKMLAAAVAVALAETAAYAYTPVRHDGTYTTNGVTYAQRGGLGSVDYVVTNVDAFAVGRVRSVNGMVGDVVVGAESVGAVARDADYLAVSNAAMGAVQKEVDPSVPSWAKGDTPPLPPDYAAVASNAAVAVKTETDPTVPAWAKAATKPTYGTNDIDGLSTALNGKLAKTGGTITGDVEVVGRFVVITPEMDDHIEIRDIAGSPGIGVGHGLYEFPHKSGLHTFAVLDEIPSGQNITNAATWAAGNAYEDAVAVANAHTDASISETNEDFVAAVQAASPPVVLPQKWALSNVTNENGKAVGAEDVGALSAFDYVEVNVRNVLISTNDYSLPDGNRVVYEPSLVYSQNYSLSNLDATRIDHLSGTELYELQKVGGNWVNSTYTHIMLGPISYGFGVEYSDGDDINNFVSLPPNAQGYFAIESWDSLSRTLNNTASNETCKAACADVLEKISESKPHLAIIDGELHIITITD